MDAQQMVPPLMMYLTHRMSYSKSRVCEVISLKLSPVRRACVPSISRSLVSSSTSGQSTYYGVPAGLPPDQFLHPTGYNHFAALPSSSGLLPTDGPLLNSGLGAHLHTLPPPLGPPWRSPSSPSIPRDQERVFQQQFQAEKLISRPAKQRS